MERKRPQRVSDVHDRRWLLHRRRQLKNTACNFKCISSRGKTLLSAGAASHVSTFVSKNFISEKYERTSSQKRSTHASCSSAAFRSDFHSRRFEAAPHRRSVRRLLPFARHPRRRKISRARQKKKEKENKKKSLRRFWVHRTRRSTSRMWMCQLKPWILKSA